MSENININVDTNSGRSRKLDRTDSEPGFDESSRLSVGMSEEEDDELSDYGDLPPPPDGGYGWVICFASFMCNMIVDGIAYTFGIFLDDFAGHFNEGKGKIAWAGSLLSGVYLSAGPIVSALANRFGCRLVCIAGSVVGAAAFILSTFSTTSNMFIVIYGVLGGFGFGMIYLPAVVAVGYYFETKRSLATGIAVCGSGFGCFVFAPVATYILHNYGWSNSLIIFAMLIFSCAIFGTLMRPLQYPKKKKVKPLIQRMYEEKQLQLQRGSIAGSYFTVQLPDGTYEKKLKMPLNADPGVHSSLNLELLAQQSVMGNILHPVSTLPTITEARVIEQHQEDSPNERNGIHLEIRNSQIGYAKRHHRNSECIDVSPTNSSNIMPRNVSQPAFNVGFQGFPKNGSVPSFNKSRKTSFTDRLQPYLNVGKTNKNDIDTNGLEMGFIASKTSISQKHERTKMVRPMSRKDIFYSASVTNLPQFQSQKSLTNYRNSVLSLTKYEKSMQNVRAHDALADAETNREQYDLCPCLTLPESLKDVFNTMLDVSLLKDPVFMLISISNVFGMAGLYVPFVYLVSAAELAGVQEDFASYLLSIIGITNTIGRIICGYVADFPQVNSLFLNNICLLIATFSVILTPLCTSFSSFVIVSIFFGVAISGYISLTSIILVDLLGLDRLTNAFGLLILFRGFAAIIGSPLAGAVYDATKSYNLSFYMAGTLFGLSTLTSFIAPCLKNLRKDNELPAIVEILTPIDEEIDEDDEDDEEDEDDQPITIVPKIIKTLPSPQKDDIPP